MASPKSGSEMFVVDDLGPFAVRVAGDDSNRARREAERAERADRWAKRLRATVVAEHCSRLPGPVRVALEMDKVPVTPLVAKVLAWMESDRAFLVLSGGTGTGKTVAALEALARTGGQFLRALRLGGHYEPWSGDREMGVEPIRMTAPMLVIDDLGMELLQDRRTLPALEEIVDARVGQFEATHNDDHRLPLMQTRWTQYRTIFTTNLLRAEFLERFPSERLQSRLRAYGTWVSIDTADMRVKS